MMASGPLNGIKVLEFAGIGPGPFTGMMLSDMGADVLRIERKGTPDPATERFDARGRRTIGLDLKQSQRSIFASNWVKARRSSSKAIGPGSWSVSVSVRVRCSRATRAWFMAG